MCDVNGPAEPYQRDNSGDGAHMNKLDGQDILIICADPEASGFNAVIHAGSGTVNCTTMPDDIPITLDISSIEPYRPESTTQLYVFSGTYVIGDASGELEGYYNVNRNEETSCGIGGVILM